MYIVDLFKRITHKSNLTVFIYLVFNVFVIGGIISYLFTVELWKAVIIGLVLFHRASFSGGICRGEAFGSFCT